MTYVIVKPQLLKTHFIQERSNKNYYNAFKEMGYSNIITLLIDWDLSSSVVLNTYYNIFEKSIRNLVRTNLRREYYDCLIARFKNSEVISIQQIKYLGMRARCANQEHILLKNAKNSFKMLITRTDNQHLIGDSSLFYERLFVLAFLFQKKQQHIEHLKKITNNYKYNDSTKYKEGLSLLKSLEYDYDKKIQKQIYFLAKSKMISKEE